MGKLDAFGFLPDVGWRDSTQSQYVDPDDPRPENPPGNLEAASLLPTERARFRRCIVWRKLPAARMVPESGGESRSKGGDRLIARHLPGTDAYREGKETDLAQARRDLPDLQRLPAKDV